jgi:uncharacterized protein YkwD
VTTWIRGSVCALALACGSWAAGAQSVAPWQEEWLSRLNQEREHAGVRPLLPSPVLNQVAQLQAEEMARGGRPLPSPYADVVEGWLRQVGYSAHGWGEGYAYPDPEDTLFNRKATLDGNFRDLGVGAATANGTKLYVFLFGWHEGDYFARATAGLHDKVWVAAEMLRQVNEARRRKGLPPLAPNPLLDRVSQEHAEDMLARSYFDHRTPEGLGPSQRAWAEGYHSGVGENLVAQRFSVEQAMKDWLASPGHRKNILDPGCRELGVGLAMGGGYDAAPGGYRVIWVQSFGTGE